MKLFLGNDTVFTSNGEKILKPLSVKEHRELGDWYIEVELPLDDDVKQDSILVVQTKEKGEQPFRINNIEAKKKMKIRANHIGFDTRRYGVELATVVNQNCQSMMNAIKTHSSPSLPFTMVSDVTPLKSYSVANKSVYEALVDVANNWNGFLDFDGWNISIRAVIGQDRGITAEYGKNIQESEIIEDWDLVVTRLKPIGNDGITLPSVWLNAEVEYDTPYTKIMEFDTDSVENLAFVAGLYIDRYQYPRVNYSVKVSPPQQIAIGDAIYVKARQFELFAEVISYDYNVLTKRVETLEFGNYRPTVKNYFSTLKGDIIQVANRRARVWIDELNGQFQVVVDDLEDGIANNTAELNILATEISTKVTATYVDNKIAEINQASPNRVSNLPDNWEQGTITSGTDASSDYHIRSRRFYPIAQGFVTYQIADLYEAKVVLYDSSYTYIRDEGFETLDTFTLAESGYFKVVVKSVTSNLIVPAEIETSNLKVANESEATAWNMYFGDLTLDAQMDQYNFKILSRTGLTFDGDSSLQLDAVLLLNNIDVTELQDANQFLWSRVSKDSAKDDEFNAMGYTGKILTITQTFLDRSATYKCRFSISETAYLLTKSGDRILTKADNYYLVAIVSEVI